MPVVDVTLPHDQYRLTIEPGALDRVGALTRAATGADRVLLAVDRNVAATHGAAAAAALAAAGLDVVSHGLVADERRKTLAAVDALYDAMLAGRLERGSAVVAVGGGVVGDVAGFAAATYLRGIALVQVPTTLLAMVDAAIGGKTGVNHPRPADAAGTRELGKNLVGAFWQPRAVVVDPRVLATLAPRDFRCGLAESVKHGLIADADLVSFIEAEAAAIAALDEATLVTLLERSARIKVAIVEADEREAGRRMLLNLGHTFAHAVEPIAALDLRHGEAVAIGTVAAAAAAVETGRLAAADAARITALLERLGLPVRLGAPVSAARLIEAMAWDKKVRGDRIRLVLPTAIGRAEIADDVPRPVLEIAWRAVGAEA